ncbi:CocE/NonD family hydrolase [Streptomyces sp. AC550_RSS872]|uniref:CocE/NonD family hydrolase n=1 Tax=Streptomyces sp. AC550_RSS872 TaxID=2823689 RepID=UPI001C25CAF5|nr:CocE/NonD family hydrolase [Streptomyces sp. AC550_RSS872]
MPKHPVLVEHDAEAKMTDGTVLRATVYRPARDGEVFPVLLTRTPYGRDLAVNSAYFNPLTVAAAGYIVVMQDCRGRFGSDGVFDPSVHEASDGADTVAWAAGLPGSDGRVGMWGRSYFAETQWRAAASAPAPLKALALGVSAGGSADDGGLYRGGAHEFGSRFTWGHTAITPHALAREFADAPDRRHAALRDWQALDQEVVAGDVFDTLPIGALAPRLGTFMNTHILGSAGEGPGSPLSELWNSASAHPVDAATLHIGGWFDIFAPATLAQYRMQLAHSRTRSLPPPRLVIGPWSHSDFSGDFPDLSLGIAASSGVMGGHGDLTAMHVAWFDTVLKGDDTALRRIPPVLLYFLGENRWRGFEELPAPTAHRTWYLADGGRLLDHPGGDSRAAYDYDPLDPVPTVGGATMIHGVRSGPADQRRVEARDDVLTFTSEPLTAPLTLFGEVRATFHASSSAPDTDFVIRLCKVSPDGVSIGLNDGIVRASWRDSYAAGTHRPGHRSTPLEPGRVYEFTVSLWSTACTLAPGERLRVQVTSSCHPRWDRNLNTGLSAYDSAETVVAHQMIHMGEEHPSRLVIGTL